jgi:hypothetical protein
MQPIKRAVLKFPDAREQTLFLFRPEQTVFRWAVDNGRLLDGVDYVTEADAIAQLRVLVEHDPAYVGVDLTVYSMEPSAADRAAKRITGRLFRLMDDYNDIGNPARETELVAQIISEETNIDPLMDSVQTLVAYWFKNRRAFAMALYPMTPEGAPRDLTGDGLMLAVIEAMQKTAGTTWPNLTKILMEPVSTIKMASKMPTPKGGTIQ